VTGDGPHYLVVKYVFDALLLAAITFLLKPATTITESQEIELHALESTTVTVLLYVPLGTYPCGSVFIDIAH
jgi:hypothetical protein